MASDTEMQRDFLKKNVHHVAISPHGHHQQKHTICPPQHRFLPPGVCLSPEHLLASAVLASNYIDIHMAEAPRN